MPQPEHTISASASLTQNNSGMLVDNIALSAGVAAESPAAVTDLTLTPEPTGLNKVTVAFTAPARTSTGVSLTALDKVEIYRDKALLKAISPVAPGQPVTFVDETVTAGNHSYIAVAYSATGRGLEASADVFVGPGKPSAVGNFKVKKRRPAMWKSHGAPRQPMRKATA